MNFVKVLIPSVWERIITLGLRASARFTYCHHDEREIDMSRRGEDAVQDG